MGRHSGWIAVMSGIAGGADMILIPEVPFDIDKVCDTLKKRHKQKKFSILVVAEGAMPTDGKLVLAGEGTDEFGNVRLGGIGQVLGHEIEKRSGIETRVTILGHIQRGGSPTAYDRVLATRFGVRAVDAIAEGQFGKMVALRSETIGLVDIKEAILANKKVDMHLYEIAEIFFG
jgi:6-phosphofructokinase 1